MHIIILLFESISDVEVNKGITIETKPLVDNEMVETQKSNDSDKTVGSGSVSYLFCVYACLYM